MSDYTALDGAVPAASAASADVQTCSVDIPVSDRDGECGSFAKKWAGCGGDCKRSNRLTAVLYYMVPIVSVAVIVALIVGAVVFSGAHGSASTDQTISSVESELAPTHTPNSRRFSAVSAGGGSSVRTIPHMTQEQFWRRNCGLRRSIACQYKYMIFPN